MTTLAALPDADARRRAVTDFGSDLLVEAGAGSGKTSLLVERLLQALLVEGVELSRIAAITFTNKAAAEMLDRLAAELQHVRQIHAGERAPEAATAAGRLWERLAGAPERDRAAGNARRWLAHLDDAVITTLHSFCGALLRRYPLATGLAPGFQEDDGSALELLLLEEGPQIVAKALESLPPETRQALRAEHDGARLIDAAREAAKQVPAPADDRATEACGALAALARRASDRLRARLDEEGWLGFTDVILRTRDLLRSNAAVRRRERARWDHLLVDELQDTDPHQYAILLSLTREPQEGGPTPRLFLVGDPKQSIYRFRGADLSAYHQFKARIHADGELLTLTTSFRSRSRLLEPLNRLFEAVLREDAGVQPPYRKIQPAPTKQDPPDAPSRVRVISLAAEGKADEVRQAEAARLVAELQARRAAGRKWKDILILLPKLTGLPILQRALQESGIPFTVSGGKSFYKRQEIADFAALLTAWLGPEPDGVDATAREPSDYAQAYPAALLAVLRSGVGAVPDGELWRYARALGESGFGTPPATPDGCPNVARVLVRLERWRRELAPVPRDEVPVRLLHRSGLRSLYGLRPAGGQAVANLDKAALLLGEQLRRYPVPLAEAAYRMADQLGQGSDSDQSVSEEDAEAVGILTVHKAKGLERKVVFVAGWDGATLEPRKGFQLWADEDRGYGVQLRKEDDNELFRELAAEDDRHLAAEKLRLLYVALTRAEEELVIVQSWTAPRQVRGNLWIEALRDGWGYSPPGDGKAPEVDGVDFEFVEADAGSERHTAEPAFGVEEVAAALAAHRAFAPSATARFASPSSLGEHELTDLAGRPGTDEEAAGRTARTVGVLVHALLERWNFDDIEEIAAPLPQLAERLAGESGLPPAELEAAAREILAGLPGSEVGAALLELGESQRRPEWPLLYEEDGVTWSGFLDLLAKDPGGGWTVVDYKTDRDLQPDEAAARYGPTLRLYGRGVGRALRLPAPPRLRLFLLHTGRVAEVPAEDGAA